MTDDLDDGVPESTIIENVPSDVITCFEQDFPDQPKLIAYVRRGWCDHVESILAELGKQDDEGEYPAFNDEQKKTANVWWSLYNEVFMSR